MRALLLAPLTLTACASTPSSDWRGEEGVDYRVDVVDRPSERRFDLQFVSLSEQPLCFAADAWPSGGWMAWVRGLVSVEIDGGTYPIEDHNSGYCVGDACGARVEARGAASGHLPYERFGDAPFDGSVSRTLHFNIAVHACHGGERRL